MALSTKEIKSSDHDHSQILPKPLCAAGGRRQALWHNLGITVSALIGIISVLSLVVCVPVFSHAISGDVLRQQLNDKVNTTHRRMFSLPHVFCGYRDYLSAGSE